MTNIKIPNILTDLAHVGTAGILTESSPIIDHELEICRQWGYRIEQDGNRIYLHFDDDQIVPYWIQRETPDLSWDGLRVNGYLQIDSTNREAVDQARSGAPQGTLICAEEQTEGKGREDRTWHSPPKSGLYFSLIVRPKQSERLWPLLTHVASLAIVRTLQDMIDVGLVTNPLNIDIKWPNDVLLSGKKCAGILLQTLNDRDNCAVVVGVGINIHSGSVPDGMDENAVSIDEAANIVAPRRKILVGFLQNFQTLYLSFEKGNHSEILEAWKKYSTMWNGVKIWIEEGGRRRSAITCGINEIGALIVQTEEGSKEIVLAGSVRIQRS